ADQSHAPSVLKEGTEGPRVRDLQAQLAALGYTGKDGKPLTADGEFGANTKHAVEAFQKTHGLDVDGKAGKTTLAELASAKANPLVSEATHANHGLYTAIGQQLPAGTRPEVVANVTLQALENGIAKPSDIRGVVVRGNDVIVAGNTPGFNARVDLTAPTAHLQAMSDHMAAQSRQATTQRAQEPTLQQ
ncbi:MAG: peptidoglycan-binding protein, partial [Pseudoxanthomonas suwonensis]